MRDQARSSTATDSKTPLRGGRHLVLGTISFTVCFAAWGLLAAFAPRFQEMFALSAIETALLVAAPVLLGSLARLPLGMLTDRLGGRVVFTALMLVTAVPVFWVPSARSFSGLLVFAFLAGLAGSSFAVGVGYVSRRVPPQRQGAALGLYGLGTIGQSLAVFAGPLLATRIGWEGVFYGAAGLLLVWGLAFGVLGRDAPGADAPRGLGVTLLVLRQKRAWLLALFYFLSFGGFVAFSIYLPTLLQEEFGLSAVDAGFRTAGFVVLATLSRPVGGWLSDRIGGARVLAGVFLGVVFFGLLLAWPARLPFSVGALGTAALLGLGSGAVFKLVPEYFPHETGTVTGLVGAVGGLGGFFPPLVLGVFRDTLGVVWPGFLLLTVVSFLLYRLNARVFLTEQKTRELTLSPEWARAADRLRAGAWATLLTGILIALIVVGSRNLKNFDPALVIYTFSVIFATWGVVYHYRVWLQKPPTGRYWRRSWEIFGRRGRLKAGGQLMTHAAKSLLGQGFIYRRSPLRWWMHQLIFWGCLLACAITFPLVFGWIHFGSAPGDQMTYVTYIFGFPVGSFALRTTFSWLLLHGLDVAAILVLGGVALSLWRRMSERGAQALQIFSRDLFPLVMLFAVSVTGLGLTVSTLWLRGALYSFLAVLHAATVIGVLLYLPFGKFFHIFQRPAQLGVKLYQAADEAGEGTKCARCKERFAGKMHIEDLREVLLELGFDYQMPGPAGHWQALCPPCKRKTFALAQLRVKKKGAVSGQRSAVS